MGLYSFYLIKTKEDTSTLIKTLKDGYVLKDSLSENPNTAIIQFKSKQNLEIVPYLDRVQKKNSSTSIVIETYVITDKIKKVVSQNPLIYSYILTLANRKAELNTKYLLPSFCVTQDLTKSKTIQSEFFRLWNNYPLETEDNWAATRIINYELIEGLDKPCKEMFFSKLPLGQAIEELFNQVDSSYRVKGNTSAYEKMVSLSKLDYNSRKIIDLNIDEISFINKEEEANGSDFIANMEGTFSNGHADGNQQTVYYPSLDSYAQMRGISNDGTTLGEENRAFIVKYPIYELDTFRIGYPVRVEVRYKDSQGSYANCSLIQTKTEYVYYDISNYVYESTQRTALDTPSKWKTTFINNYNTLDKSKALFYEYKGTHITGSFETYDLFGIQSVLENIVSSFGNFDLNFRYQHNQGVSYYGTIASSVHQGITTLSFEEAAVGDVFYNVVAKDVSTAWKEVLYQVRYKTMLPSQRHRLEKIDTKNININTVTNINQANAVLNINDAGEKIYFELNRIAENKVVLCGKAKNVDNCLKIGVQSKDGYVVTEVETTNFNDYSEFKATLVKNFTNINVNQSIDKEFRPFEISNKGIKSDLYYTEYIMFSTTEDETLKNNNSFLKSLQWLRDILGQTNKNMNYAPTYALFQSDAMSGYYVAVPVISNSFANSIEFHFEFDNQINAGNKISPVTNSKYRNSVVKYTDDKGEFNSFRFMVLCYGHKTTDQTILQNYPYISETQYNSWFQEMINSIDIKDNQKISVNEGIISSQFEYMKDASEIFSFTYQLMFVPVYNDIENIVVGPSLTSKNNLVMSGEPITTIYSSNSKKYSIFNNQKGLGSVNSDLTFTASISSTAKTITINGDTTGLTSIGLCDSDGNLFLGINAVNGEIPKTIYIYFRNKRA